jgi:hypothetical protein
VVSVGRSEDEFAEADGALDGGHSAIAAELVDRLVELRAADGPSSPGSGPFQRKLAAAEDLVRHQPRERLIVLDPAGRVTLYSRGGKSQVLLPVDANGKRDAGALARLERAHCLTHNHPTETGRPIGGTLSLADIVLAERFEVRRVRVAAPEATYCLHPRAGTHWDASWVQPTTEAYRRHQASLDRAMAVAPGTPDRDIYFFLRVFDFLMVQFAKGLALEYERVDRPRAEWASAVPSPLPPIARPMAPSIIDDGEHFRWVSSVLGTARG